MAEKLTPLILMANGQATGVLYASEINKAAVAFGVPAALLQSMRDIDSTSLLTLPSPCMAYAEKYAKDNSLATSANENGVLDPESHFMAVAWFLDKAAEMTGSEWAAVSEFYGGGPLGRIKTVKIASGPYERRKRQWQ